MRRALRSQAPPPGPGVGPSTTTLAIGHTHGCRPLELARANPVIHDEKRREAVAVRHSEPASGQFEILDRFGVERTRNSKETIRIVNLNAIHHGEVLVGRAPRTDRRLPKSSVDTTPGSVSSVRNTLSIAPATANTSVDAIGVAEGRTVDGTISETTSTVSVNELLNRRTSSSRSRQTRWCPDSRTRRNGESHHRPSRRARTPHPRWRWSTCRRSRSVRSRSAGPSDRRSPDP